MHYPISDLDITQFQQIVFKHIKPSPGTSGSTHWFVFKHITQFQLFKFNSLGGAELDRVQLIGLEIGFFKICVIFKQIENWVVLSSKLSSMKRINWLVRENDKWNWEIRY